MSVSVRLSVCLSVTEVHWRIIANSGFKFRSQFTAHCSRGAGTSLIRHNTQYQKRGRGSSAGRVDGSFRAMLATARPSCSYITEGKRVAVGYFARWRHWRLCIQKLIKKHHVKSRQNCYVMSRTKRNETALQKSHWFGYRPTGWPKMAQFLYLIDYTIGQWRYQLEWVVQQQCGSIEYLT